MMPGVAATMDDLSPWMPFLKAIRGIRARALHHGLAAVGFDLSFRHAYAERPTATASSTIPGSRIVKVEPRPGWLSTVMSPPIIWQKRLLIASPRPVPPYLRVVDASACENSWNSLS